MLFRRWGQKSGIVVQYIVPRDMYDMVSLLSQTKLVVVKNSSMDGPGPRFAVDLREELTREILWLS